MYHDVLNACVCCRLVHYCSSVTAVNSAINNELWAFDRAWLSLNCNSAVSSTSALRKTARGAAGLCGEDHRREQWPHTAGAESEQRRSECLGRERQHRLPLRRHHPLQRASQVSSGMHCSDFFSYQFSVAQAYLGFSALRASVCYVRIPAPPSVGRATFFLFHQFLIFTALKMRLKPSKAFFFFCASFNLGKVFGLQTPTAGRLKCENGDFLHLNNLIVNH